MQIIFSDHAVERMHARDILKLEVYATVKSPQEKVKSYRDRTIYTRKFGFKTLEVITKLENNKLVIISAYMVK
jgi:hypothetical protein